MNRTSFQVIEGGRVKDAHDRREYERKRAEAFRQAEIDPKLRAIAPRVGIDQRDVLPLIMEEAKLRIRAAEQAGYLKGQRSYWVSPPPPAAERRAA